MRVEKAQCRLDIRSIVLPASSFDAILDEQTDNLWARAYNGDQLSTVSGSVRGNILAGLARIIYSERHPNSVIGDAVPGRCINGTPRGVYRAEYDWCRNGLRIECKSSMMTWQPGRTSWSFNFRCVKVPLAGVREQAEFDELLLVLYSPRSVYIYQHDGELGVSRKGSRTSYSGHQIQLYGPRGLESWRDSLVQIIGKLDAGSNGCQQLAVVPTSDTRIRSMLNTRRSVTHQAFRGVPSERLPPHQRALRIRSVVRRVDAIVNPVARLGMATPQFLRWFANNRGQEPTYTWQRGDAQVKCKCGQLAFDSALSRWKVVFTGIHKSVSLTSNASVEELLLGMYTPRGIYVYRHDSHFGLSKRGMCTAVAGFSVQVYGPADAGVEDWNVALDAILQKFDNSSCVRIALVQW